MDGNFINYPLGLGAVLSLNDRTGSEDENLSEAEKEHILFKCKDAKTEEERDRIMSSLSPEDMDSMGDLFRGPGIG